MLRGPGLAVGRGPLSVAKFPAATQRRPMGYTHFTLAERIELEGAGTLSRELAFNLDSAVASLVFHGKC